jgi:hypothetical protein
MGASDPERKSRCGGAGLASLSPPSVFFLPWRAVRRLETRPDDRLDLAAFNKSLQRWSTVSLPISTANGGWRAEGEIENRWDCQPKKLRGPKNQ